MEPSASQWQIRDDVSLSKPVTEGNYEWSPWRKNPGSEIEQRTQIDTQDYPAERVPERQHRLEFEKREQQENLKPPSPPFPTAPSFPTPPSQREESIDFGKNYEDFPDTSKYGNRGPSRNMIDFENKHPPRYDDISETRVKSEDENLYEGVSVDSTVIYFSSCLRKQDIFYSPHGERNFARVPDLPSGNHSGKLGRRNKQIPSGDL